MKKILFVSTILLSYLSSISQNMWTVYDTNNSPLPINYVSHISISDGTKWIGPGTMGIMKLQYGSWTHYSTENSDIPFDYIVHSFRDDEGNMWFSNEDFFGVGLGIAKFDGIEWTSYNKDNCPFESDDVLGIDQDSEGNLWFGARKELLKFDGTDWTIYNKYTSPLPVGGTSNLRIRDVAIQSNDKVWFAVFDDGFGSFDGTNWNFYNTDNSELPSDSIYDICVDNSDNVWISGWKFILKIEDDDWLLHTSSNSNLIDDAYRDVNIDNSGVLWATTSYHGFAKLENGSFTYYNSSNSPIGNDWFTSIAIDEFGNKWAASDDGLYVYNENGINNMDEFAQEHGIEVFPNPVAGNLTVGLPNETMHQIEISNMLGEKIISMDAMGAQTIDMGKLKNGVYILSLKKGTQLIYTDKIIKK